MILRYNFDRASKYTYKYNKKVQTVNLYENK